MKNMKTTKLIFQNRAIFFRGNQFGEDDRTKKPARMEIRSGFERVSAKTAAGNQGTTFMIPFMIAQWPG